MTESDLVEAALQRIEGDLLPELQWMTEAELHVFDRMVQALQLVLPKNVRLARIQGRINGEFKRRSSTPRGY